MRSAFSYSTILCTIVGGLGGVLVWLATPFPLPLPLSVLLGILYGLIFALLLATRVVYTGSGLLWGLGYAVLLWLAVPTGLLPLLQGAPGMGMLDEARSHFPELVAYVLFFGFPLGLTRGIWNFLFSSRERMEFTLLRAIIVGGLAGLVGGWAFSMWFTQNNAFVLIAGIVNSNSSTIGMILHYSIAAVIGASLGLLGAGLRPLLVVSGTPHLVADTTPSSS